MLQNGHDQTTFEGNLWSHCLQIMGGKVKKTWLNGRAFMSEAYPDSQVNISQNEDISNWYSVSKQVKIYWGYPECQCPIKISSGNNYSSNFTHTRGICFCALARLLKPIMAHTC